MLKLLVLLAFFGLAAWLEVPPLLREGRKRELLAFALLALLGLAMALSWAWELPFPNPEAAIHVIFAPPAKLLFHPLP